MTRPLDSAYLNDGQKLAVKYFSVAMILFFAQLVFGMLAGIQYLHPDFLYGVLDFNVNRMVHINAMIVWMLYGFIGSVYWFLEEESGGKIAGLKLGNLGFWVLTAAVAVVVAVYLLVQSGPGNDFSRWFINEGREYIEAPRWADIGIVVVMLIFFYNVAATFSRSHWSGIAGVLTLDLVALAGLYLAGMFYVTNISVDQYWWWWVIHLGGGDMGSAGRLHHGVVPDAPSGGAPADRRNLALHRSGADVRFGDPGAGAPLFLDRCSRILACHRRLFLRSGTHPPGGDGGPFHLRFRGSSFQKPESSRLGLGDCSCLR